MELDRDQTTGDYVQDESTGKPTTTDGLGPAIRTRMRAHRGKWLYATDASFGSDFYAYKKKKSVDFRDGIGEAIAEKALEPLTKDGRADNIEIETQFSNRGGVAYSINLLDRKKRVEYRVTTPIGVPA